MPPVTTAANLRSVTFRRERERSWAELERLVERVGKDGIASLGADELARLPHLYRATLSALSVARAISLDRALTEYLESLCARAYVCVYGTRDPARGALAEFVGVRFPRAVRRQAGALALAVLLMACGALAAFAMVAADPEAFYAFVPEAYAAGRDPTASTESLRAGLYDHTGMTGALAEFAASLFSHNAGIGLAAFALGVAVLPTMFLVFLNGLILGAFAALYDARGLGWDLWGWLLPHGVTELLAVVLCGAAGLSIGRAWIFPGRRARLDNLREAGRDAGVVAAGAVGLFFAAGLIEGIFRQTVTDREVRWAFACATAVWWAWYFGLCGRGRGPGPTPRPGGGA